MLRGDYLNFWGKAQPAMEAGPRWHPLVYHSLDVAAFGHTLLARNAALRAFFGAMTGVSAEALRPLLAFALACHDLGKYSASFQQLVPTLAEKLGHGGTAPTAGRHDELGIVLWNEVYKQGDRFEGIDDAPGYSPFGRDLIRLACCHHGVPKRGDAKGNFSAQFPAGTMDAVHGYLNALTALFWQGAEHPPWPTQTVPKAAHWPLAGFFTLCDHIGSNQRWFPYQKPEFDLATYWHDRAIPQAEAAVDAARLGAVPVRSPAGVSGLVPAITAPTPLQDMAARLDLAAGPQCLLIEENTGGGKTEAALILAQRLIAAGRADGVYFALPTMATANAMHDRLRAVMPRFFAEGVAPVTVLSHSAADLAAALASRRTGYGDDSNPAEVTAKAWAQDDRRRAFFAHFGAGTVDQALLSVLPSRFQCLRLFGLMRQVLILDEIHAFDAYSFALIERLLEFQAGLGGSVIALSATLPTQQRQRLTAAFRAGLGKQQGDEVTVDQAYPLITRIDAKGAQSLGVKPAKAPCALPVSRLPDAATAISLARKMAEQGAAVLWIRNTVDDARESWAALRERGLEAHLVHSRFALQDRLTHEQTLLHHFGKASHNRAGVVVATQIAEMSLDIDADVLISDLAPIDALIQRAGRLWRHERAARPVPEPQLHLLSPDPGEQPDADWYARLSRGAATVYGDHGRLWRTARLVLNNGLRLGVREQIERIYAEDDLGDIPPPLQASTREADGRRRGQGAIAGQALLKPSDGFTLEGPWRDDSSIATRWLEQPMRAWRLARWEDGILRPWAEGQPGDPDWLRWRLSEISVAKHRLETASAPDPKADAAIAAQRAQWPDHGWIPEILALVPGEGGTWCGHGLVAKDRVVHIRYTVTDGLTVSHVQR